MQNIIYFIINGEMYIIDLDQTIYFKAEDHYTHVYYSSGTHFMIPFRLSEVEMKISANPEYGHYFIRSGRTYILNKKYIFHVNTIRQIVTIHDRQGFSYTLKLPKSALRNLINSFKCRK